MSNPSRRWELSLRELENEFRRLVQGFDLIVELDRSILQTNFDLDVLFEEMLKGLRDLVGAEYAQVLLRRGPLLVISHSTNPEDRGKQFKVKECVCGLAVQERKTISSGDVRQEYAGRYKWVLGRDENHEMVSEVAVPIYAPSLNGFNPEENIVSGVINIESPHPNAFSHSQTELVEMFALQAGTAIHNARIHNGLALTLKLTDNIQSSAEKPDEALRDALGQLSGLFHEGVIVQFLIHDSASGSLVIKSSTVKGTEGKRVLVEDSFSGLVIKRGAAVRSNNVHREYPQLFKDTVKDADAGRPATQSELAAPIRDEGRVIGVLNVESPETDAFSQYDEYLLTVVASTASVWNRILSSYKRSLALEQMATVGNVAGHLIHTLNSGLLPLERIASRLQQIGETVDPAAREQIGKQVEWLRSVAPSIKDSINKLHDMYTRAQVRNESVNINETAVKVADELVTRDDVAVRWELDPDMPPLRFSAGIYHVFWNLISNALQAIKEGQSGEITVGTRAIHGEYTKRMEAFELYVKDTGEGMTPDKLKQIFKLDYSSKEGRITGYGLWWVKTFATRWDGEVEPESEVGKGTTMLVRFPLPPPPPPPEEEKRDG